MEKFYCEIWDQKINENQCYLKRDPSKYDENHCCLKCLHHPTLEPEQDSTDIIEVRRTKTRLGRVITLSERDWLSDWQPARKRRSYIPPSKINKKLIPEKLFEEHPEINYIPWILRIDSSFWENSKFLRWQLMRLNKKWQEDFREVFNLYLDVLNDGKKKNEKIMSGLNKAFQYDYPPDSPGEKFDSWVKSKKGECDLFLEKELSMSCRFREGYKNLLRVYNSNHELIGFRSRDEGVGKFVLPYPEYFLFAYPPPIDYEVRFPLPFFLEKLPPYKEVGKIKAGSPLNWSRNLLIYELMQKEIDLEMVCHLTFKNKKRITKDELHSQKEQVKRIIKRVEISVSNSYPFSSI